MLQTAQQQKSELEKSLKQSKTNEAISINIQKQKDQAELEALDAAQAQALEKKLKPLRSEISHIESEDKKIEKQIFDLISKIEKKNEPREFNLWEIQELFTQINENSQKSIQNWKNIKSLCKQAFKIISDFSMPESRFSWEPMYSKAKSKLLFLNVSTSSNEATRKTKLLKISILNATSFEESLSLSEKVISEAELRKHYDHFKKVKLLWAETVQHAEMASTSWKEAAETALLRPAYLELQEVETLQQQFENAINNYYAWTAKKIAMEISACKAELNEFAYQAKLTLDLNEALSLWNQAFQKHAEGRLIYDSGIATISSYMTQIPPQFQSWWKSIFIKLMENRNAWHAEQASLEEIKKEDIMIKSPHELEALTTSTTAIEDSIEASEHEKQGK
ncbi:MAG: hypothetical protein FJ390_07655 [Verrucomicrobia bacterium]|nr:hypothetical protein [Verrucomicrobiota bacterium]